MTENRKNAYRWLLYCAMLSIRPIQWFQWKQLLPWNLVYVFKYKRYVGVLANALHNLAFYSAHDFEKFDEDHFWSEVQYLTKQGFPKCADSMREAFEIRLAQLNDPTNEPLQRSGCMFPIS